MANGDKLRYVRPGERVGKNLSAGAWNAFIDTTKQLRGRKQGMTAEGGWDGHDHTVLLVKNSTGADLARFAVAGIGDPVFFQDGEGTVLDEFKNRYPMSLIAPDADLHTGAFAVAIEPIASGKIGRAKVFGVTPVKLSVTATGDQWAEIEDGVTATLKTGATGSARILYKQSGTGEKWGVVRFGDKSADIGGLFRVDLTQTGGSNGTKTTAASYTYTVTDLAGVQLATGASPEKPRENGTKTAATKGYGYYDAAGTFVLAEAWEAPGTVGAC
jgi:hypothetical protein